jgi:uncharacterized membrane protein YgcG
MLAGAHPRLNKTTDAGHHILMHKLTAANQAASHEVTHDPAHENAPFALFAPKVHEHALKPIKEAAPYHAIVAAVAEPEPQPAPEDLAYASWRRSPRASSDIAPTNGGSGSSSTTGGGGRFGGGGGASGSSSTSAAALEGRVTRRRGSEVSIRM